MFNGKYRYSIVVVILVIMDIMYMASSCLIGELAVVILVIMDIMYMRIAAVSGMEAVVILVIMDIMYMSPFGSLVITRL